MAEVPPVIGDVVPPIYPEIPTVGTPLEKLGIPCFETDQQFVPNNEGCGGCTYDIQREGSWCIVQLLGRKVRLATAQLEAAEERAEAADERADHDGLTGLYNQAAFLAKAKTKYESHPHKENLFVVFIDADYFKPINDNHGHETGDRALQEIAEFLRGIFRKGDLIARYGGDEFCILLDSTPRKVVLSHKDTEASVVEQIDTDTNSVVAGLGEKFRGHLSSSSLAELGLPLGLSVGIARGSRDTPFDLLLKQADARMYEQKQAGR